MIYGKKWSLLSKIIKGRNEHAIKYHFFSLLKKHGVKDQDLYLDIHNSKILGAILSIRESISHTNTKISQDSLQKIKPSKKIISDEDSSSNSFSLKDANTNCSENSVQLHPKPSSINFSSSKFFSYVERKNKNDTKTKVFYFLFIHNEIILNNRKKQRKEKEVVIAKAYQAMKNSKNYLSFTII